MLTHTSRWSHPPGNQVVPSRWQATVAQQSPAPHKSRRTPHSGEDPWIAVSPSLLSQHGQARRTDARHGRLRFARSCGEAITHHQLQAAGGTQADAQDS